MYTAQPLEKKITLPYLQACKERGEKFVCLTAYDFSFAQVLENSGIELVLVGDSLGMVMQGRSTTVPVTVNDMIYHGQCVSRGLQNAMLMIDMPFGSLNSVQQTLDNASAILQKTEAQLVKLEGGAAQLKQIEALNQYGIATCAHLGLQPQSVHKMGGYKVQGRNPNSAESMKQKAIECQQAGADLLLLECVPGVLAAEITAALTIPVIGIGAGQHCDGQILVLQDILGISNSAPKFSRNFLTDADNIPHAIKRYVEAVKNNQFPAENHTFN